DWHEVVRVGRESRRVRTWKEAIREGAIHKRLEGPLRIRVHAARPAAQNGNAHGLKISSGDALRRRVTEAPVGFIILTGDAKFVQRTGRGPRSFPRHRYGSHSGQRGKHIKGPPVAFDDRG